MNAASAPLIAQQGQVIGSATCVCETCLAPVPADIVVNNTAVYYLKNCPTHGPHRTMVSSDPAYYLQCRSMQTCRASGHGDPSNHDGCSRRTAMAIVEVTEGCNARCPTCSAASSPDLKAIQSVGQIGRALEIFTATTEPPHDLLMVSGGEPTLHPNLLEILCRGHETGFHRVMLITNGILLARDQEFAEALASLGSWLEVYLQFDSLDERVLREIRGEDLREVRLRALENLESHGIATTLVSVLKGGLNLHEVGQVIDFALTYACVRGVTFQPLRAVGRTDGFDPSQHRLTLAEVRAALIETGRFPGETLRPHPSTPETVCIGYLSRKSGAVVTSELFGNLSGTTSSDVSDSMFFLPKHSTSAFSYEDLFRVCIVAYMDRFDFSIEGAAHSRMHFIGADGASTPLESRYLLPRGNLLGLDGKKL
jgi:7,8-dihydro-6-hydroxymethylpterin dimethyltransferase